MQFCVHHYRRKYLYMHSKNNEPSSSLLCCISGVYHCLAPNRWYAIAWIHDDDEVIPCRPIAKLIHAIWQTIRKQICPQLRLSIDKAISKSEQNSLGFELWWDLTMSNLSSYWNDPHCDCSNSCAFYCISIRKLGIWYTARIRTNAIHLYSTTSMKSSVQPQQTGCLLQHPAGAVNG